MAARNQQTINFQQALSIALKNNPNLQASSEQLSAATDSLKKSKRAALPDLQLEVNASASNNPLTVFGNKLSQQSVSFNDFGLGEYSGPNSLNTVPQALNNPGYYTNINTGFALNIPIYVGGRFSAKKAMAESNLRAVEYEFQNMKATLAYRVFQYYEGTLISRQLVDSQLESRRAANHYLSITKALFHQSINLKSDVLLARSYQASSELQLKESQMELTNQLIQFHQALGLSDAQQTPGNFVTLSLSKKQLDELIKIAGANNSEIQALKARLSERKLHRKLIQSENRPQLNLQLRQDWNDEEPSLAHPSNTALLQLKWKFFDFGKNNSALSEERHQYLSSEAQLNAQLNRLAVNLSESLRAANYYRTQWKTDSIQSQELKKAVNLLVERYSRGAALFSQVLEAQLRYDAVRNESIMAHYRYELAKATICFRSGYMFDCIATFRF